MSIRIGMFDMKANKWLKFEGPRLFKPIPEVTDGNSEAYRQWRQVASDNPDVVLRRVTDAMLKRLQQEGQ